MATPTQDEIERARALVFGKNGPSELADDIAQALADTRERETERCAGIAEPTMSTILLACGEMTAGERRTVAAVLKWIAHTIRKGA